MSVSGLLLGVINIFIIVLILLLVGALILWFCQWLGITVPDMVRKLYLGLVGAIALGMLVALLLGIPTVHFIAHATT